MFIKTCCFKAKGPKLLYSLFFELVTTFDNIYTSTCTCLMTLISVSHVIIDLVHYQWMVSGERLAVGLVVVSLVVVVYGLENDLVTVPHHLGVVQIVQEVQPAERTATQMVVLVRKLKVPVTTFCILHVSTTCF